MGNDAPTPLVEPVSLIGIADDIDARKRMREATLAVLAAEPGLIPWATSTLVAELAARVAGLPPRARISAAKHLLSIVLRYHRTALLVMERPNTPPEKKRS